MITLYSDYSMTFKYQDGTAICKFPEELIPVILEQCNNPQLVDEFLSRFGLKTVSSETPDYVSEYLENREADGYNDYGIKDEDLHRVIDDNSEIMTAAIDQAYDRAVDKHLLSEAVASGRSVIQVQADYRRRKEMMCRPAYDVR